MCALPSRGDSAIYTVVHRTKLHFSQDIFISTLV